MGCRVLIKYIIFFFLWIKIIPRRRSKFSQPAPRGFASSQNIAAVDTKLKKSAAVRCFCVLCPRQELNLQLLLRTESLYPFNYEDLILPPFKADVSVGSTTLVSRRGYGDISLNPYNLARKTLLC